MSNGNVPLQGGALRQAFAAPYPEGQPSGYLILPHKFPVDPNDAKGKPHTKCCTGPACTFSLDDKIKPQDVGKSYGQVLMVCNSSNWNG